MIVGHDFFSFSTIELFVLGYSIVCTFFTVITSFTRITSEPVLIFPRLFLLPPPHLYLVIHIFRHLPIWKVATPSIAPSTQMNKWLFSIFYHFTSTSFVGAYWFLYVRLTWDFISFWPFKHLTLEKAVSNSILIHVAHLPFLPIRLDLFPIKRRYL